MGPPQTVTSGKPTAFKRKLPDDIPTTNVLSRPFNRAKHIYWNVAQLNTDTRFVTDFKVNRALSFVEPSLASKHPELIRYLPDDVDKEWMFQQQIISAAHRTNRFLVLVHDEVLKAARSEAHKSMSKIGELDSFRVPEFMLQKMRIFFAELSSRSQTFIVQTSTSSGGVSQATESINTMSSVSYGGNQQTLGGVNLARARSSLSSSHATLSALLAGGSVGPPGKNSVLSKSAMNMSKDAVAGPSTMVKKDV